MNVGSSPFFGRPLVCAAALFAAGASAGMVQAPPEARRSDPPIQFFAVPGDREFSGRMIVRPIQVDRWLESGLGAAAARERIEEARAAITRYALVEFVPQTGEYVIAVPEGATENDVAASLLTTGVIQYAEPDWIVYPLACPNDSRFSSQWHHVNMDSCAGWDIHTGGPSVSVGICDTGIRTTHEDFQQHRLLGYNAVDRLWENQGGAIGPIHPHGTMTTGCAAANGDNGVGIAGVGWNLSHRMLRVSDSTGGGSSLSTLQHAARTAVENGDKVASVSYSGVDSSSNLTTATYIRSLGGLLVWAAGNDGRNLTFGNRDNDDIIVVGATDINDNKASFSAYGQFVDLVAPGVSVFTTDSGSDNDYASVSGTSFSTPLTAGLAALIWSANPALTSAEVEAILKGGTDDLGTSGIDNTFGYGRINTNGSLLLVGGGGGNQPPVASLAAAPLSGNAPLNVSFDASASSDPDGTIADFSWDFDGDGFYDQSTGTSPFAAATYTIAGVYNATVRVTDDGGATDTDSVTINVTNPGGNPGSLAFDGFESRNFSGGTGSWVGSWITSGDINLRWNRDGPHSGSGHVRLRRGTGYIERGVDLSGASSVHLTFWAKVSSFESGDRAEVWVSPDGVNYTLVRTLTSADGNNVYRFFDIDLSGFAMTSNFRIAFDADMNATSDNFYVDDIDVVGVR